MRSPSRPWIFALAVAIAVVFTVIGVASAVPDGSGLPLPRFVSLRADKAKMRTGPGVQYPEDWVYVRRGLPLEIIAEHHTWRKVRDWQGTRGWMHQSLLSGERALMVIGETRDLRQRPEEKSLPIARVEVGVVGQLLACPEGSEWCRVEIDGFKGWLKRAEFWGVYSEEVVE